MDLTQENGASSWLTALPLEEFNLSLHKGAFHDAVTLRYGATSELPQSLLLRVKLHCATCPVLPNGWFPNIETQ